MPIALPCPTTRQRAAARRPLLALALVLGAAVLPHPSRATACEARSGPQAPTLVELYTSEGCSSCPPADRWLSGLNPADGVLALAFHVTYWDRLGWPDRFAQPAFTERQRALMAPSGARYVYTPQVIVDGRDWRNWPRLPLTRAASPADIRLGRDGDLFSVRITAAANQPAARWSGYWAWLEDGHRSDVRSGENAGEKLRHDHVVRHYQPVGEWPSQHPQVQQWRVPRPADAASNNAEPRARRVVFVVTDAATQRPLQALALGC